MSLICMESNIGYHSIRKFYKTLKFGFVVKGQNLKKNAPVQAI